MVSSGAVYGTQPSDITHVSEDFLGGPDPLSPSSAYGEGKRVAELLCGEMHSRCGVAIPIARCFAFVGPFLPLDRHFAIGNFLRDTLLRKPVVMNSAGRDFRSYMYAADLTAWLWTMLTRVDGCRAYNVGSDAAISIAELARAVAVLTETEVVQRCSDSPIGKSPTYYVPSIERAKRELGLEVEIDLQTAVARTFAWYQQRYAKVGVTEDLICA
jgi:dTDP-glucose 4,6-dehydratase